MTREEFSIRETDDFMKEVSALNENTEHPLPPAEGARKVQWSGYGELGNIKQSKLPTEDDIEKTATRLMRCYLKPETAFEVRKAFIAGAEYVLGSGAFTEQDQPTAEGAEEIIESVVESLGDPTYIHNHVFEIRPYTVEHKTEWWIFHKEVGSGEPLAQWLNKFATLHAQRLAEKMGEDEFDKMNCLIGYLERWWKNPQSYPPVELGSVIDEAVEYLKTRDSHD